jgi:hypothetical protein
MNIIDWPQEKSNFNHKTLTQAKKALIPPTKFDILQLRGTFDLSGCQQRSQLLINEPQQEKSSVGGFDF